jgi:formylglycine-generating enzyme required for sulfatase activity
MRQFVDVIENLSLNSGQGKALHVDGDLGWTNSLNDSLPKNKAALVTQLKCDSSATWSDDPAQNNELPVNCVTFPVAYAFCIWDGGRLPTEAEWNFAAAGGSEQRIYPWQLPAVEDLPTPENASWFNADSGPQPAGSKPKGDARWGHADLASNVQEWVLDYVNGDYVLPCTDCMNATVSDARGVRGGAWTLRSEALVASSRSSLEEGVARSIIGFRCARDSE